MLIDGNGGHANVVSVCETDYRTLQRASSIGAGIAVGGETKSVCRSRARTWRLPTDQAILIGLIVNELVANVLKYAFRSETKGIVMVTLKRTAGELHLTVADNGSGIDMRRVDSGLGGQLVEGFAQQLGGKVERDSGHQGTIVRLILPGTGPVQTSANP